MSHLRFYNYPGVGEQNNQTFSYSQAVRIGDRIEISGQGELRNRHRSGRRLSGVMVHRGQDNT